MAAYVYARVSTFEQYINGYSTDAQVRACLQHIQQSGLTLGVATNCDLPGVFIDGGKSAYTKRLAQRPGGQRLMAVLRPGDTVVAVAIHRLFRRHADMIRVVESWIEAGVAVRFTEYPMLNTDTANGKAMLYVMSVMAQLRSELSSARVRESREINRAKAEPKPPKPAPEFQTGTKDIGAIMQQVRLERQAPFQFTGVVRVYVRCSTKEQSVEAQSKLIEAGMPAELQGAPTEWYVDEGVSAFRMKFHKRAAGARLLKDLKPGDVVLAWRPDRMFRSIIDTHRVIEQIHAAGASVITVEGGVRTDNPYGRVLFQMLGMFAEIESRDIGMSTKRALFAAVGQNKAAQALVLPQFLRPMVRHAKQKHFAFTSYLTEEERFTMHIEFYLTQKNYRDRRMACRVISNKYLRRKGLPAVEGMYGELARPYLAKVKAMQAKEYSERRQRLIEELSQLGRDIEVSYPLNIRSIARVDPVQQEFLRVAKMMPGRLRDKQELTRMASRCVRPEGLIDVMKKLG